MSLSADVAAPGVVERQRDVVHDVGVLRGRSRDAGRDLLRASAAREGRTGMRGAARRRETRRHSVNAAENSSGSSCGGHAHRPRREPRSPPRELRRACRARGSRASPLTRTSSACAPSIEPQRLGSRDRRESAGPRRPLAVPFGQRCICSRTSAPPAVYSSTTPLRTWRTRLETPHLLGQRAAPDFFGTRRRLSRIVERRTVAGLPAGVDAVGEPDLPVGLRQRRSVRRASSCRADDRSRAPAPSASRPCRARSRRRAAGRCRSRPSGRARSSAPARAA